MKKPNKCAVSAIYQQLMPGIVLLSICLSAQADLTVVSDYGGQPAAPFYDAINNDSNQWERQENLTLPVPPVVSLAIALPIRTPEMTPGAFESRPVNLPGIGALYLVGDDPLSRAWLERNAAKLNAINALGMVVNIDSEAALRELQALAQGGIVSPMPGSDLARRLQLSHYPVLITETLLTQQVK